ncbi:TPA: flavodoxin [Streptococcus suis]|nr:flavodoxin [Streptococcus suis]HEL1765769.1 flavodoxin [Streptococcus suis]HEL2506811.1 flavodoxin [Streptococcus suis]HEM5179965.1 flavodoxin [Streptococcus suis]HEM5185905.1 flavodoxin [Streptococcus suis]
MALAKIVYASMTGNTEEIADIVASKLEELGLEVQVHECTTIETEEILDADLIVVASYTYSYGGDGELPDEIVDFYADLADLDLTGKVYGVCGSGDTFYDDFCSAVGDFDVMLGSRGATKGAENVKVDLAAEDEDIVNLEQFATDLVAKLDTMN